MLVHINVQASQFSGSPLHLTIKFRSSFSRGLFFSDKIEALLYSIR